MVVPVHRRGPWSQHEDHALLELVAQQGASNWVRIAASIGTRSPKQCRERYHQNLKPTLNHQPITAEEGELIEQLVQEMGKRWADIARRLNGRSDNAVKNWWNGGQNRRRRGNADRRGDSSRNASQEAQQPQYEPQAHHMANTQSTPYPPAHHAMHHANPSVYNSRHGYPTTTAPEIPFYNHQRLPAVEMQQYHDSRQQHPGYHPHYNVHPVNLPPPTAQPSHTYALPHRPQALDLHAAYLDHKGRPFHTPQPSPTERSIGSSGDAPSLITDNGSETRSPHSVPSPNQGGLPPLIGDRSDRRLSSVRHLPTSGFAAEDDENAGEKSADQRRASLQLPLPQDAQSRPAFHEPVWSRNSNEQLRTPSAAPSRSVSGQLPLPDFNTLSHLPAPRLSSSPQQTTSKPEPPSPGSEHRDSRMNLAAMLS